MYQYAFNESVAKWEDNYLRVYVDRIQSVKYPDARNDTGSVAPKNWIYTDNDGNFLSAQLSTFFDYIGMPATFTVGALTAISIATGTMTSSGLYTAIAGIAVTAGGISVT